MVTYIHMPVFEDSKRSRGFATVTFTKSEYVPLALELDGSKLKGGRCVYACTCMRVHVCAVALVCMRLRYCLVRAGFRGTSRADEKTVPLEHPRAPNLKVEGAALRYSLRPLIRSVACLKFASCDVDISNAPRVRRALQMAQGGAADQVQGQEEQGREEEGRQGRRRR